MRRNFRSVALVLSITFLAAVAAANADDAPVASGVSADGKVHADMFSLKRTEGDTTLRFAIVNDSNRTVSTTLENMRLIDLVGRTSYEPGVTSSSCSAEPGGKAICWARLGSGAEHPDRLPRRLCRWPGHQPPGHVPGFEQRDVLELDDCVRAPDCRRALFRSDWLSRQSLTEGRPDGRSIVVRREQRL